MAMSYKTPEAVKYQKNFTEYVQNEVAKQDWIMSKNKFQHYYMDCIFYFDRLGNDANNYFKCLADSITDSKCVWIDDIQLCERVQGIYIDSANPRVEINLYEVDYVGIFKNVSQLEKFKSNCIQCTRYKQGKCSIFNKAIEGRIQEEIIDFQCMINKQNKKVEDK